MEIRLYPDPVLRIKSSDVSEINKYIKRIIREMKETMEDDGGIGLAANQVGITEMLMTIDFEDGPQALINPQVISVSEETQTLEEGCLSFPGLNVPVSRPLEVSVQYTDENGYKQSVLFTDLYARVFMHEYDHLNGKLIIDYLNPQEQLMYNMEINKRSNND